jgi:acyl-[acyl-carrier-protein]-phospholipid O-acyltransferase / long-chain-fatty-acid--[acyl-carrier-protein] ligase
MTKRFWPRRAARDDGHSLFRALLEARRRHGGQTLIVEDVERKPLSYRRLVLGAVMVGRRLAACSEPGEHIGVLLPNANGALVAIFGLSAFRRVPAMLNVSAGAESMIAACTAAGIRTVVSSRQFIAHAKLEAVVEQLSGSVRLVMLEDLRVANRITPKMRCLLDAGLAKFLPGAVAHPDTAAAILFTSGSEGTPKAVVLSHRNILTNCHQLASVVDFTEVIAY